MSNFFDRFGRSVWRLETQSFYADDAAEFGRYQQGLPPTAEQRARRAWWVQGVRSATTQGRRVGRVLVVNLPLSPYWRWRLETAREHVAAGEDIRVAVVNDHPELATLGPDFWLVDDALALVLTYAADGRFLDNAEHYRPATLRRCRHQRDLALAASVPLQGFLLPA